MELQPLTVKTRAEIGKGAATKLRAAGQLPAVLYGQGDGAVSIVIDEHEFRHLVHTKGGEHSFIDLTVEDKPDLNCRAMIKDVQHHPIRGHFLHADLYRIDMTKKITTLVSVVLVGQAKGAVDGGVIDHLSRELEVECLPANVPDNFIIDITEIEIGGNVLVRDVPVPEGVEVLEPGDRAIMAIHAPRVVKTAAELEAEALEAGEAEAGEEGEGAPAAEGDDGGEG